MRWQSQTVSANSILLCPYIAVAIFLTPSKIITHVFEKKVCVGRKREPDTDKIIELLYNISITSRVPTHVLRW